MSVLLLLTMQAQAGGGFTPILRDEHSVTDPCGDTSWSEWDITGDPASPAAFVAFDEASLRFRVRLAQEPTDDGGLTWRPFSVGVLIESDWDEVTVKYDAMIWFDGPSSTVALWDNAVGTEPFERDGPEREVARWPAPSSGRGAARIAPASSSLCGADGDWFIDLTVPWQAVAELTRAASPDDLGFAVTTGVLPGAPLLDVAGCPVQAPWGLVPCEGWWDAVTDTEADADGDGISDRAELAVHGTDPNAPDTDGDGLDDHTERLFGTDPVVADTDGGGILDGAELHVYGSDPKDPHDDVANGADSDHDGLSDWEESQLYGTNPKIADGDVDGLVDGHEVMVLGTDPADPDSDGDGLTDGEEVQVQRTDPLDADTDGGGVPDGSELEAGTDPLDPSDDYAAGRGRNGDHDRHGGGAYRGDDGGGRLGGWLSMFLGYLLGLLGRS